MYWIFLGAWTWLIPSYFLSVSPPFGLGRLERRRVGTQLQVTPSRQFSGPFFSGTLFFLFSFLLFVGGYQRGQAGRDEAGFIPRKTYFGGREDDKPGKGTGAGVASCIILDLLVFGGRICFCLLLTRRSGLRGEEAKRGGGWNRHDDEEEEQVLVFASAPFSVTERQDAANLWLIFGGVVDNRGPRRKF